MINKAFICFVFFCFISFSAKCQEIESIQIDTESRNAGSIVLDPDSGSILKDSVPQIEKNVAAQSQDTIAWVTGETIDVPIPPEKKIKFKPNSSKAVLYTAIFPGLGQIYNQKYWKLPIVYGGLVGLVYAITWNGRIYGDYTDGYRAIMKDDYYSEGNRDAWLSLLSRSQIKNDVNGDTYQFTDASKLTSNREKIRRSRDFYRRNRDLAIIGVVGLYAISMIDAYVDAELFDFDISPDLSFRVAPYVGLDASQQKMIGIQCNIIF